MSVFLEKLFDVLIQVRLVILVLEMFLQGRVLLGLERTRGASKEQMAEVRFLVRAQHGQVHAGVVASEEETHARARSMDDRDGDLLRAFERFRAEMIAQMVFQVMLVFRHEWTTGTFENFVRSDVHAVVCPVVFLGAMQNDEGRGEKRERYTLTLDTNEHCRQR